MGEEKKNASQELNEEQLEQAAGGFLEATGIWKEISLSDNKCPACGSALVPTKTGIGWACSRCRVIMKRTASGSMLGSAPTL